MTETTYRTAGTLQFHCLTCGFQSGKSIFRIDKTEDRRPVVRCPDCESIEIIDADSKVRINPQDLK
jgi:DNA-directed RNA polymerase subunit RPC12/RpoP